MKALFIIIPLLVCKVSAGPIDEPDEYAPYEVIKKAENYEERVYPPAKWVCHNVTAEYFTQKDSMTSFFALFMYITGENDLGEEINMTAPVSMKKEAKSDGENLYQMCFYLPESHQVNPPNPTNSEVYIEDRPELRIFTKTFGGYVWSEKQWEMLASRTKAILKSADVEVKENVVYRAGYDSPMKIKGRRNEVWFVADN